VIEGDVPVRKGTTQLKQFPDECHNEEEEEEVVEKVVEVEEGDGS
jgi:hypothetical protein